MLQTSGKFGQICSTIGNGIQNIKKSVEESGGIINGFFTLLANLINKLQKGFRNFLESTGIAPYFDQIISYLGPMLQYIGKLQPAQFILLAFGLSVSKMAANTSKAVITVSNSMSKLMDSLKGVTDAAKDFMTGFKDSIKSLTTTLTQLPGLIKTSLLEVIKALRARNLAKDFLRFAIGISMLALSFGLLAKYVDPIQLAKITGVMALFVGVLVAAITNLATIPTDKSKGMGKMAALLISMGLTMAILAGVVKILTAIPLDQFGESILKLAVIGYGIVKFLEIMQYVAPIKVGAIVGLFLGLAIAFDALAIGLAALSIAMSFAKPAAIAGAIFAIVAFMGGVALVMKAAETFKPGAALAIVPVLGIIMALYMLVGAILLIAHSKINAQMIMDNWEAFAIVIGALAVVIVVANRLASSLKGFGIAIVAISVALGWLSGVIKKMTNIRFDGIGHFLSTVGVFLVALAGLWAITRIMEDVSKASVKAAVAAVIMAAALNVIVLAFKSLKKLVEEAGFFKRVAMMNIFTTLVLMLGVMTMVTAFTRYAKVGPILAIIAAFGLLVTALTLISILPPGQIAKMTVIAVGLAVFFAALGYAFAQIANASMGAKTGVMIAFAVIIAALVGTLIYLTTVPWQQVAAAGAALAGAALGIGVGLYLIARAADLAKGAWKGAIVIMATALALIPAAYALSMLANFKPENVLASTFGLVAVMMAIAVAAEIANAALLGAASLLLVSISLIPAAYALSMLANFNPAGVITAVMALGSLMFILALSATVASFGLLGAATLLAASLSLVPAAMALAQLASFPAAGVLAAAEALMGVMLALAGASLIAALPGVAIGMIAVSGALISLSVALYIIAQAAAVFAGAMALIVTNLLIVGSMSEEQVAKISTNMQLLGTAIGQGLANIVIGAFSRLLEAINHATGGVIDAIKGALDWIRNSVSQFISVAQNIGAGIINGLQSAIPNIVTAASELCNKIIDTIKSIFGIHSPSTVMEALMGLVGEGGQIGIKNSIPGMEGAASMLGSSVIAKFKSIFSIEAGKNAVSGFLAGMRAALARGLAEARSMMESANLQVKAWGGDISAKASLDRKSQAKAAAKDQEKMEKDLKREAQRRDDLRNAQAKAAVEDQKKLEKEMAREWHQEENPLDDIFNTDDLGSGSGGGDGGGSGGSDKAEKETEKKIDQFTKIMDYARDAVDLFRYSYASTKTELSDTQQYQASKNAVELLALELYKQSIASETAEEAAERMGKTQAEVAADIKKAYLDMQKGVEETLKSQLNMYEKFESKSALKGGELASNIQTNADALKAWDNELARFSKRLEGVEGGVQIYNDLVSKGMDAMPIIKGWLDMTDEEFEKSIKNINEMPENIHFATTHAMSGAANVAYSLADGFKEVLNIDEGTETGGIYGNAVLDGLRESLLGGGNLQGEAAPVKELANEVASTMKEALDPNSGEAKESQNAASELGDKVTDAMDSSMSSTDTESVGRSLVEGIAKGIRDNASIAINAAIEMATSALEAAKNALGIASPSKAFMELGYYSDEGLAQGFSKYGTVVREAAAESALGAVDEMSGVFGRIADLIDGTIDLDPTIRPVLDLTNLQYGASQIGSLLGLNDPYALNAVGTISGIQNDAGLMASLTSSLTDAINGIKPENDLPPVTINIYPTENQSAEEIAEVVSWKLNHDVLKRRAVYGGT